MRTPDEGGCRATDAAARTVDDTPRAPRYTTAMPPRVTLRTPRAARCLAVAFMMAPWGFAGVLAPSACTRSGDHASAGPSSTGSMPSSEGRGAVAGTTRESTLLDMLAPSPRCRVEHRGAFFDLGAPEIAWSTPGRPDAGSAFPAFEREGATWGRVLDRTQSLTFAVEPFGHPPGPTMVQLRGRARGGHKVVASIDGKSIGVLTLSQTDDRVVSVTNPAVLLEAGLHVLTLHWTGPAKKDESIAEIDWIRVAVPDDDPTSFAAPTRRDTVGQVAVGGAPRVAYTLMAPSVLRCLVHVPVGASVVADAAVIGGVRGEGASGVGEIEIREYASGTAAPDVRVLATRPIASKVWTQLRSPLTESRFLEGGGGGGNSALSVVEIAVTKGGRQTRVAIAEPRIVLARSANGANVPGDAGGSARRVPKRALVIVLAGLSEANLALPAFAQIAHDFVLFRGHRAGSSVATSSLASLMTGVPVPVHAVDDVAARLSSKVPQLGRLLGPFGIETDFATDVPISGAPFGFASDAAHVVAHTPLDGPPKAFDAVEAFLADTHDRRALIIAHTRGAHPPWDVAADALKTMAPDSYSGVVDPRHVVAVLAKVRRGLLRLTVNDRIRIEALRDAALDAQLARLSSILEGLRAAGALDDTLVVITGDAPFIVPPALAVAASSASAMRAPATAPSASTKPVTSVARDDRALLEMPLLIRFPGAPEDARGGLVIDAPTDPTDVTATLIAAFGGSIAALGGRDLREVIAAPDRAEDTPRLLDDGHGYQLVYANVRLIGAWGRTPQLRIRGVADELHLSRPFEYEVAWGLAAEARAQWMQARSKGPGREPATIDSATALAMDSWEKGAVTAK